MIVLGAAVLLFTGASPTILLEVAVSNVHNDRGHVLVAVCVPAEFLSPHCRFVGSAPAHAGTVTVRITGIPPGTYAVQAFQDKNDNLKVDRDFLGLPTEGIGFSNNAQFHFGPPSFNDAAIALGPDDGQITISLRYFRD